VPSAPTVYMLAYLSSRLFSDEDDIASGIMDGDVRDEEAAGRQAFQPIDER
jgi:hypothetical protein